MKEVSKQRYLQEDGEVLLDTAEQLGDFLIDFKNSNLVIEDIYEFADSLINPEKYFEE